MILDHSSTYKEFKLKNIGHMFRLKTIKNEIIKLAKTEQCNVSFFQDTNSKFLR